MEMLPVVVAFDRQLEFDSSWNVSKSAFAAKDSNAMETEYWHTVLKMQFQYKIKTATTF